MTHLAHSRMGPTGELYRACDPTVPLDPLPPEYCLWGGTLPPFCPECLSAVRGVGNNQPQEKTVLQITELDGQVWTFAPNRIEAVTYHDEEGEGKKALLRVHTGTDEYTLTVKPSDVITFAQKWMDWYKT